jgi:hypothetical protein
VIELYEQERRRSLVSADIPIDYWRWLLQGINPRSPEGWATLIILDPDNRPCGYALPRSARWGPRLGVRSVALVAGVSYQAVVPSLLRALQAFAAAAPSSRPDQPLTGLAFTMGTEHPLYQVLGESLAPRRLPPYAWYVRVPDLPGFVRHIAPVLEERLAASPAVDRSGQLLLDFYRGGLRLVFKDGRLAVAENWQRPLWVDQPGAGFPPLVFLQLLFGRRDLDELRYAYPDVWASDQAELLLRALFPRAPSYLMELN